jgi:hypothetical protein
MSLDRLTALHARLLRWYAGGIVGIVMPVLIGTCA